MVDTNSTRSSRRPVIGAVGAVAGLVLVAYGIGGVILGSTDFRTDPGGTVDGETWLGIEANGWSNVLFAGAGVLLIVGSPSRLGVALAMVLAGLGLGAVAIIAPIDGEDVFGVFAANGWTMLAWGVTPIVLLAAAALSLTGARERDSSGVRPPTR